MDLRLMEVMGEREVGEERGDREGLFLRFDIHLSYLYIVFVSWVF